MRRADPILSVSEEATTNYYERLKFTFTITTTHRKPKMKVTITITGTQSALDKVMALSHPEKRTMAHRIAGRALRDYVADWYRQKGEKHWINPNLPTHGPGRTRTGWATTLHMGWQLIDATADSATIGTPDEHGSLRHKINGGTISAKKARALTIPLVPEAHGRKAKDYAAEFRPLFTLKKKNNPTAEPGVLFEALNSGGIRAVYALKKSIKHAPWPDAMPKNDDMQGLVRTAMLNFFITDAQS